MRLKSLIFSSISEIFLVSLAFHRSASRTSDLELQEVFHFFQCEAKFLRPFDELNSPDRFWRIFAKTDSLHRLLDEPFAFIESDSFNSNTCIFSERANR